MSKAIAPKTQGGDMATIERVLIGGDLERLTEEQRVSYYLDVCKTLGLNPTTRPFDYIKLNGKLVLYANKGCAEQLRQVHKISIRITARETHEGVYVVTAQAEGKGGKIDESTGAVTIQGLRGDALANAMMKAETKAKRRVTLSICGLNMLDETEVETIPANEAKPFAQEPLPRSVSPLPTPKAAPTREQLGSEIRAIVKTLGLSREAVNDRCMDNFNVPMGRELSDEQMSQLLAELRREADSKGIAV